MTSGHTGPVMLIDASIYIFRSYFSLPDAWHHHNGMPVNAVYGFSRWLVDVLSHGPVSGVLVAFDESLGSCFRNDIYGAYKQSRELPDESLEFQLPLCQQVCQVLGVAVTASDRYEADDLIASAARLCREANLATRVLSADKDLAQLLLRDEDQLWDFGRKPALGREQFMASRGFDPAQVPDLLALMGDSVDDIPGVPGIGEKTAAALLGLYGSVECLLEQPETIADCGIRGAKRHAVAIAELEGQIRLAKKLASLREDALPGAAIEDFEYPGASDSAGAFFSSCGLESIGHYARNTGLLS